LLLHCSPQAPTKRVRRTVFYSTAFENGPGAELIVGAIICLSIIICGLALRRFGFGSGYRLLS
jgi:hypothetical protein